jgi:putative peptide zinc metalloprotease protein
MNWPTLREELDLLTGPTQPNAHPSWIIHDPVRHQFHRIDWQGFEILSRWELKDSAAIVASVNRDTPLDISEEDVKQVLKFVEDQELINQTAPEASTKMAEKLQARKSSWWKWLIHHYLFFRVPLVRPDDWLERWSKVGNFFFSKFFAFVTLFVLVMGVFYVSRQWDHFKNALVDTFSLQGLAAYGIALIAVKILHELGHGFVAKKHGCRVPAMGVAFLVMFPMAYTDTNEAWTVKERWRRFEISSAGIKTELIIASWATFLWAMLPDGAIRSAVFFLAAVSWVISVALNASPFMRFDGYFILSDMLDFPNLHGRSFALARWKMREWLFALGEPPPEVFEPWKERALVAFAFATWLYRLVLFIGIALLIYYMFTKMLGILLFVIEIYWFILSPVRSELLQWWERREAIQNSMRARAVGAATATILMLFVLPLPTRVMTAAIFQPSEVWGVFAPGPAKLQSMNVKDGALVAEGQLLMTMEPPDVLTDVLVTSARLERLDWQAQTASQSDSMSQPLALSNSQFKGAAAEAFRAQQNLERYQPKAPFTGIYRHANPDTLPGQWIAKNESIGVLVGPDPWKIEAWVDEHERKRLSIGDVATFYTPSLSRPIRATVTNIDEDASRELPDGMLTAPYGGPILVRQQQGRWLPEHAMYRVVLTPYPDRMLPTEKVLRGQLSIRADWESIAGRYVKSALSTLLREISP